MLDLAIAFVFKIAAVIFDSSAEQILKDYFKSQKRRCVCPKPEN